MITINLNNSPTRGILSVSTFLRVPLKHCSITSYEYVVGYHLGSSFRKVYTSESLDNAIALRDDLQGRVSYKCFILKHTQKLVRI